MTKGDSNHEIITFSQETGPRFQLKNNYSGPVGMFERKNIVLAI